MYFTYGMHFCVNMVCLGEEGPAFGDGASAVLLRAGKVIAGEELARARRARGTTAIAPRDLARGPARLCQALGDRPFAGRRGRGFRRVTAAGLEPGRATRPVRELCQPGGTPPGTPIATGPRVGVSRAAEIPWRFWFDGDPTVSVYRPYVARRKLVTP